MDDGQLNVGSRIFFSYTSTYLNWSWRDSALNWKHSTVILTKVANDNSYSTRSTYTKVRIMVMILHQNPKKSWFQEANDYTSPLPVVWLMLFSIIGHDTFPSSTSWKKNHARQDMVFGNRKVWFGTLGKWSFIEEHYRLIEEVLFSKLCVLWSVCNVICG